MSSVSLDAGFQYTLALSLREGKRGRAIQHLHFLREHIKGSWRTTRGSELTFTSLLVINAYISGYISRNNRMCTQAATYTAIYPPRFEELRGRALEHRWDTTSLSMYGTSCQKSLCLLVVR